MKKIILATIVGVLGMSNSFAECTYNFDASVQDLKTLEASLNSPTGLQRYIEQVSNINNANQSGYDLIRYYSDKNVDIYLTSKKIYPI
uniref:hypothetical protein n=1 Tax=Acinetobacter seifertii TaxID=1530123 RepID=UPI0027DC0CBF|nr:hypothetical protein [Acinetobacter seifertii]